MKQMKIDFMKKAIIMSINYTTHSLTLDNDLLAMYETKTLAYEELLDSTHHLKLTGSGILAGALSYESKLKTVRADNCTYIGELAFYDCNNLEIIDAPNCLHILKSAFAGCCMLRDVCLNSCRELGAYTFQHCESLEYLNLSACTSIGKGAFEGCSKLHAVYLPECIMIDELTFDGCQCLEIVIAPSCKRISNLAFIHCSNLQHVFVASECKSDLDAFILANDKVDVYECGNEDANRLWMTLTSISNNVSAVDADMSLDE